MHFILHLRRRVRAAGLVEYVAMHAIMVDRRIQKLFSFFTQLAASSVMFS